MKYTVVVIERHVKPWCSGVLDSREEAVQRMNLMYEEALKFEGLSDEEVQEALDDGLGGDYIYADESLGSGKFYQVTSINEGEIQ